MTTTVVVKCNGPCYRSNVRKTDQNGEIVTEFKVGNGEEKSVHVGQLQTLTVTESFDAEEFREPEATLSS